MPLVNFGLGTIESCTTRENILCDWPLATPKAIAIAPKLFPVGFDVVTRLLVFERGFRYCSEDRGTDA
ncbi:hypothetical protein [Moorena sp. SIO4G3]|uniref:hypothetical protein n=1 Tax=Moorena sp. SIO4G3 TaxID=2607821 RepID=UPI00142AC8AD|nr:hypothetical protein [Moorena sp. SIO4G3]NEO81353.1 hypothetical protein [Moorena sp. SIO4G3]